MNLAPSSSPSLRCWAEIDTQALQHNARVAAQLSGGGPAAVMAVVKADAYGHGISIVVPALAGECGSFAVANLPEAEGVARCPESAGHPIFILSPSLPAETVSIVRQGFIPAVSTPEEALAFAAAAGDAGVKLSVNAVIDTGMGRMGVLPEHTAALLRCITARPELTLHTVSSHFPSSDEDEVFTREQDAGFHQLTAALQQEFGPFTTHIANSAGILHYPRAHEPVRAGLLLYGHSPQQSYQHLLRPVLTWKTRITLVRELPAGWTVSYGRTCRLEKPTLTATLAAGYADGYPRQVSGHNACVEIHGRRCPILGRVTMDQIVVDVSDLPGRPVPGAEVLLMGGSVPITELAAQAGTIPWHILTGITERTVRVAVDTAAPATAR